MSLLYKPDWDQTMENYKAWWAGEDFGRCSLNVTARRAGTEHIRPPKLPDRVEDRWLDCDYLHAKNEYQLQTTFFGGEAVPVWGAGHPGWAGLKALLGCEVTLGEATGWVKPIMAEGSLSDYDMTSLKIDFGGALWKKIEAMHRFAVEEARGKCLPYFSAIGHTGDTLAGIRSTEQLLYDVVDEPEVVHDFDMYIIEHAWKPVYDRIFDIVKEGSFGGCVTWMNIWAPGRCFNPSNDFTYMISTDMYRDIFWDSLRLNLSMMDYTIYHVDGVGAFKHVDALLELDGIQGFQILPGAGKPSPLRYMDVLRKVQAAGKLLHIGIPAREVKDALENLSSKGLYIHTSCETEEDARTLLKLAEKESRYY